MLKQADKDHAQWTKKLASVRRVHEKEMAALRKDLSHSERAVKTAQASAKLHADAEAKVIS